MSKNLPCAKRLQRERARPGGRDFLCSKDSCPMQRGAQRSNGCSISIHPSMRSIMPIACAIGCLWQRVIPCTHGCLGQRRCLPMATVHESLHQATRCTRTSLRILTHDAPRNHTRTPVRLCIAIVAHSNHQHPHACCLGQPSAWCNSIRRRVRVPMPGCMHVHRSRPGRSRAPRVRDIRAFVRVSCDLYHTPPTYPRNTLPIATTHLPTHLRYVHTYIGICTAYRTKHLVL